MAIAAPGVAKQYEWLAPGSDWRSFATLAELQKATGQEAHGVELDYDIFENLAPPDPPNVTRPTIR